MYASCYWCISCYKVIIVLPGLCDRDGKNWERSTPRPNQQSEHNKNDIDEGVCGIWTTLLYRCEAWTPQKDTETRIELLEIDCA